MEQATSLVGKDKISMSTMPPVEVIENGQRVANPRMDPSIMTFVMLASIASQAVKIRKYFDDRTSKGYIRPYNVTVTDVIMELKIDHPSQSFSLHNDGPNPVNVGVNNPSLQRAPININEDMAVDFETHKLKWLYLQCARAQTANVRIIAKE